MVMSSAIAVSGRIEWRLQYKSNFALSVRSGSVILFVMINGLLMGSVVCLPRQVMGRSRQKSGALLPSG
jgi:hypothetical protein